MKDYKLNIQQLFDDYIEDVDSFDIIKEDSELYCQTRRAFFGAFTAIVYRMPWWENVEKEDLGKLTYQALDQVSEFWGEEEKKLND